MPRSLPEKIYSHFYQKRKHEAEHERVAFPDTCIISVGNITTGGTGKTPAVQWLTRRLIQGDLSVVIVARGYGGSQRDRSAIVSDGRQILLDAASAGDEPILHARSLPSTPVVIGRNRVAATRAAITGYTPQVVVLDDGFQYWSLARNFDLVLLDARRPFGNGKLLPRGRLREPPEALRRASGVLLTRADAASEVELQQTNTAIVSLTNAPIFQSRHAPVVLRDENNGARLELSALAQQRIAALSALADNDSFFDGLKKQGAHVVSTLARRDHHHWQQSEIKTFARRAIEQGASAIVATEKDAVKLKADWCSPLPLWSLVIELQIEKEEELWNLIKAQCRL